MIIPKIFDCTAQKSHMQSMKTQKIHDRKSTKSRMQSKKFEKCMTATPENSKCSQYSLMIANPKNLKSVSQTSPQALCNQKSLHHTLPV